MATIYANADTGDDSTGDGSSGNPYETIITAAANSSSGDTIFLQNAAASYGVGTGYVAGTNFAGRILEGESAEGVVIDGTGRTSRWELTSTTVKTVTYKNFPNSLGVLFDSRAMSTASLVTWERCIFTDNGSIVFFMLTNGAVEFDRCIFKNFVYNGATCSLFSSRDFTYTFNNCTFYFDENSNNFNFYASSAGKAPDQFEFRNCIIANDGSATVTVNSPLTDIDYSCYYNVTVNGSATIGGNVLTVDPQFLDAGGGDFRLRPSSPCIDSGVAL